MIKILVVGQTPPPYGGQAIMIEQLLKAKFNNVKLYHVRLSFSKEFDESGKVNFYKMFHLLSVICKIIFMRFKYNIRILYYPPAGRTKIPMLRDIVILLFTRPFFTKTIFHFHAGGVSELYDESPKGIQFFFRLAYWHPDVSIRLSVLNPEDAKKFKTKKEFIIPNGVKDFSPDFMKNGAEKKDINLLYVGIIRESKGILFLIESLLKLCQQHKNIKLNLVGVFDSKEFRKKVTSFVNEHNLPVITHGVLHGREKFIAYRNADIFCFPSYYEVETFGLVLLEAMQFELPIVATYWRGIPDVVVDGENGYLVPIKNSEALTEKLKLLIGDHELREKMGRRGRQLFLEKYSLEKHITEMEKVFNAV